MDGQPAGRPDCLPAVLFLYGNDGSPGSICLSGQIRNRNQRAGCIEYKVMGVALIFARHPHGGAEILSWNIRTKTAKFFFWVGHIFYCELVRTKPRFGEGPAMRWGSRESVAYQTAQKRVHFSTTFHCCTLPLWLCGSPLTSTGCPSIRYRDKTPPDSL